ncbi:MAG: MarR family winged helix-turn-helix transcriptional regulator [Pseudomonadota bacterium]
MEQEKLSDFVEPKGELPLRRFVTYRISRVQAKLNAQASRILQETSGITLSQWRVIALVGAVGQTQSSKLSKEAALDKSLLSRNLKTLIEQGVMASRTDAEDHRVQILSLTDKGRAIFEKTLPVTRARQTQLREGLTDEDLKVFHKVLDHLEIAAEK